MDTLKEYGTKEEVEKMESDINSLVSKVLPTVDNKTVEDVSTAIKSNNLPAIWEPVESLDMTNEEKIEFLNNVADFLSGIPEYDAVVESIESESDNILMMEKKEVQKAVQYALRKMAIKREMEKAKDNPEQMSKLKEMSNYLDLQKEK